MWYMIFFFHLDFNWIELKKKTEHVYVCFLNKALNRYMFIASVFYSTEPRKIYIKLLSHVHKVISPKCVFFHASTVVPDQLFDALCCSKLNRHAMKHNSYIMCYSNAKCFRNMI